jgi:amino acid adenylation domain-containing protein
MDHLLHHLLRASADAYPERPAVVDGDRSLTYAELDAGSDRVSNLLADLGIRRGDRVGLYLDKSLESLVGIYGILKAGAAYVPLDPQAPTTRLAYITRNCGITCLLTGLEKRPEWAAFAGEAPQLETLVALNGSPDDDAVGGVRVLPAEAIDAREASAPAAPTIDLDLAYILYTSGSTGEPKGVKLSHLNAITFVRWATEQYGVTPEDRLSSHAPLHFDLSVFDLYAAAMGGAAVIIVPPRTSVFPVQIKRFIDSNGITIWYSVPSILSMLVQRGSLEVGDLPGLRTMLFAGEVFPTKYLRELMRRLPHVRFANLYGPTETNVCTYYEVPPLPEDMTEPIPIGAAIGDVEVFAVTDDGALAGVGEVGELYARGATVMQGYWGDPERTAKGLVPNPFGGEAGDLSYRTGDLVRLGEDGQYRLLGRRDAQIKSRGYRIELGEVETALYAHPSVVECAVVPVPDDLVTNRIKAYLVLREEISENDLVAFCEERIPKYMVPELFEFRDVLPKTSTGKIDRRGLTAVTA